MNQQGTPTRGVKGGPKSLARGWFQTEGGTIRESKIPSDAQLYAYLLLVYNLAKCRCDCTYLHSQIYIIYIRIYLMYLYIYVTWRRKIESMIFCPSIALRVPFGAISRSAIWQVFQSQTCWPGVTLVVTGGTMPGSQVTYIQVLICVVNHPFFLT